MTSIVFGLGEPSPLDREHIVNAMFKACKYGRRIIFVAGESITSVALAAAEQWKHLNGFSVELQVIDRNNGGVIPDIYDAIYYFVDSATAADESFQSMESRMRGDGVRVYKYILGEWDTIMAERVTNE